MTSIVLTRMASCAAILALAFPLAGCSQATHEATTASVRPAAATVPASKPSKALRKYIAAAQTKIPTILKSFDGLYSDFTITAGGTSTMVYEFTFARQIEDVGGVKSMKGMIPSLKTMCDTQIFPEMKRAKVKSPEVRFRYINADGTLIWSPSFKPK